jgi:hypothetical protein
MAVQAQPIPVLLDPPPQGGPLADQGLVGHLGLIVVGRNQAGVCQDRQHIADLRRLGRSADQLVETHPPASLDHRFILAQLGQPEEDVAGNLLLVFIELVVVDHVRSLGDGPADAARCQVARDGHRAATAALPGLEQGMREQGHGARLGRELPADADVLQQHIHQSRLELPVAAAGRLFDRPAQLRGGHRSDVLL